MTVRAEDHRPEPELSGRTRLRVYVRHAIAGQSSIDLSDVTTNAIAAVKADRAWLDTLLAELLGPLVYEEARLVIAETREPADPSSNLVLLGDTVVSRQVLQDRATVLSRKWTIFTEHAGDRFVPLLDMNANDLEIAEAERRARGGVEYAYADTWATLRKRLQPGQTVRTVWSVQQIETAYLAARRRRKI